MSYLVTSPLVLVRVPAQVGDGYRVDYHYEGSVVPWLSDAQAEHFLAEGLVKKVGNAAADSEGTGDPGADPADGHPKKAAPKADWVEFAVADGYDRDEVEAMSKLDIQALFD